MGNLNTKILKGVLFLFITLLSSSIQAVTVTANSVGLLPSQLVESSGLDFTGGTHFWSMGDSGGPDIFRIANDGTYTKTITITNATNRNWEDLTHDVNRTYMYIGDVGNNNNDRTNLRIYRIPYPSFIPGTTTTADVINFSYPDQTRFPSSWMNFDSEAIFHFHGKIYIFTKADGSAIGYTKMYSIPDIPGDYVATLVDSFYTNDRITSADICPNGTAVVLISNTHIHIFKDYVDADFFGGDHTQLNIAGGWTQKEAVTFSSNNEIYMTDENTGGGNHLYYIDLNTWLPAPASTTSIENISESSAYAYPMPANQSVNVLLKDVSSKDVKISLYDLTGKIIYESRIENPLTPFNIRTSELPSGIYFYKVFTDGREIQTSRLVVSH